MIKLLHTKYNLRFTVHRVSFLFLHTSLKIAKYYYFQNILSTTRLQFNMQSHLIQYQ